MTISRSRPAPSVKRVKKAALHSARLDIQGLRGVAILIGVPFHAGLPVPGGFIGLDMFFIISGFVITGMIYRERVKTGYFSFSQFYLRRFKRLTPALALMVGVTMTLAFLFMSPFGVQRVASETGFAAMLLTANFAIAQNTGDYFGVPAKSNPLLHTWSLSVEEQFYLVFPAILLLGWYLARRTGKASWPTVLVGIAALLSFWFAMVEAWGLGPFAYLAAPYEKYLTGYYGTFGRCWEFAAGALLALILKKRPLISPRYAGALATLGLILLGCSPWVINGSMRFPGPWTLLPVSGILLIIAVGTHHSTWVNRALSMHFLVKFGDWSYSLYLWHWPLIVFASLLWPQIYLAAPLAGALSILPAVASYRWVEQPFRKLPAMGRPRAAALIGAVVCPAIISAVALGVATDHYWIPKYRTGEMVVHPGETAWDDFNPAAYFNYFPCADEVIRDGSSRASGRSSWPRCSQSKPGSHIDVALVGDSHAEHLFVGLAEAVPDKNVVYYIRSATLPVRSGPGMSQIIDHVAADPAIRTVIVSAGWMAGNLQEDELIETLQSFTSRNKSVFVTDDLPKFPFDAVDCKYRIAPIVPMTRCTEKRTEFESQYARYVQKLINAVHKVPGTQLVKSASYFCDDYVCSMSSGANLLFRDSNHLNNTGSRFVVSRMIRDNPALKAALNQP